MVCWLISTCVAFMFTLSSYDAVDHLTKISAILYQDAFLPCETRHSLIDWNILPDDNDYSAAHYQRRQFSDQINLILWYRNEMTVPFYAIDARVFADGGTGDDDDDDDDGGGGGGDGVGGYDMLVDYLVNKKSNGSIFAADAKHINSDRRFVFDVSKSPPVLRIKNITEVDEAVYTCRVEYASQGTFTTQIKLMVFGPPIGLHITDHTGSQLDGTIGPFNEFESVTLICKAFGGSPKPSVIWYRQQNFYEEMIDDSFETVFLENPVNGTVSMVVNEFVIRRLTRDDYMARYICRVSSKFHYRPLTQSITIDMNLMPVNVRIFTTQYNANSLSIVEGDLVELNCRTEGSKPNAMIEWFFDHQRIVDNTDDDSDGKRWYVEPELATINITSTRMPTIDRRKSQFLSIIISQRTNSTLSVIRFVPTYLDNNRILSCHVWNPFIDNSMITDKIALDVKYAPRITIDTGVTYGHAISNWINQTLTVVEHLPLLELNCHIKANPWVHQVLWYRIPDPTVTGGGVEMDLLMSDTTTTGNIHSISENATTVSASVSITLTNHNQTLRLINVHRSHSSNYRCVSTNTINTTHSDMLLLNVAYSPQCRLNDTHFMDVVRNQPIKTACELDANPIQDLTFHWTIFSPWTNSDINFNIVEDTGKLDLDWAIKQYLQQSNNILAGDAHNESHTTLLLQCRGENIAGRQQTPCSYLLRIQNGPPARPTNCSLVSSRYGTNSTIRCTVGDDGGTSQTIHLIGYASNITKQTTGTQHETNYRWVTTDKPTNSITTANAKWILHCAPSVSTVEFSLTNITTNQSYDLVVYAQNLIGSSDSLVLTNFILKPFDDNVQNQNEPWLSNQAYLRFKGFLVVIALIILLSIMSMVIKTCLYTKYSNYGTTNYPNSMSNDRINQTKTLDKKRCTPSTTDGDRCDAGGDVNRGAIMTDHSGPTVVMATASVNCVHQSTNEPAMGPVIPNRCQVERQLTEPDDSEDDDDVDDENGDGGGHGTILDLNFNHSNMFQWISTSMRWCHRSLFWWWWRCTTSRHQSYSLAHRRQYIDSDSLDDDDDEEHWYYTYESYNSPVASGHQSPCGIWNPIAYSKRLGVWNTNGSTIDKRAPTSTGDMGNIRLLHVYNRKLY